MFSLRHDDYFPAIPKDSTTPFPSIYPFIKISYLFAKAFLSGSSKWYIMDVLPVTDPLIVKLNFSAVNRVNHPVCLHTRQFIKEQHFLVDYIQQVKSNRVLRQKFNQAILSSPVVLNRWLHSLRDRGVVD